MDICNNSGDGVDITCSRRVTVLVNMDDNVNNNNSNHSGVSRESGHLAGHQEFWSTDALAKALVQMDLVKSHLMFAVREEVDVLKEQIKELLEKNQQLEQENNALKAAAPPEVLQQLSTQTQTQTQPPTSSS